MALLSLFLALAGAFTLVGSIVAVFLGIWALRRIARSDSLLGTGYALGGVVLGIVGAGVTLTILLRPGFVEISPFIRRWQLVGQLEAETIWPVSTKDNVCVLPKAEAGWQRCREDRSNDPVISSVQGRREVLLINSQKQAWFDLTREASRIPELLEYEKRLLSELAPKGWMREDEDIDDDQFEDAPFRRGGPRRADNAAQSVFVVKRNQGLAVPRGWQAAEWVAEVQRGTKWRFLIRVYRAVGKDKKPGAFLYIARFYAPADKYSAMENEAKAMLDSLQISR
jgi:hypothetical protein